MKSTKDKKTTDPAVKEFLADVRRMKKLVQTKRGFIVINHPVYPYKVPLDKCTTHLQVINWIIHFSQKNWVTVEILELFAIHARNHIGDLKKSEKLS